MAKHITYPNRLVIQEKLKQRASYSEIANAIDKAKSTITYEIKNKSKPDGEYCAKYAQELYYSEESFSKFLESKIYKSCTG